MTMYEMQASHLFCVDYFVKDDVLGYLREKGISTEDMDWDRPEVVHYEILTEESLPDTYNNYKTQYILSCRQWQVSNDILLPIF